MNNKTNWDNKRLDVPKVLRPADITSIVYASDWYVHYLDDRSLDNLTGNFRLYRLHTVEGNAKIITDGD